MTSKWPLMGFSGTERTANHAWRGRQHNAELGPSHRMRRSMRPPQGLNARYRRSLLRRLHCERKTVTLLVVCSPCSPAYCLARKEGCRPGHRKPTRRDCLWNAATKMPHDAVEGRRCSRATYSDPSRYVLSPYWGYSLAIFYPLTTL